MQNKNKTTSGGSSAALFTPGPWRAEGCAVYQADNWKNGNNLGGAFICGIDENLEPTDERGANAALIAAAPDLLEAAAAALKYLEANRPKGNIREIFTQLNEHENAIVKPLRAAIAKAEGRPA